MRLLIDGYNLMFESSSVERGLDGKHALRAARGRLLHLLVDLIEESMRAHTLIVFDSKKAPPDLPDKYEYFGIKIVFARDWNSADELIQAEIRRHSAPKQLSVVTSDHAIQRKARARGATVIDSDQWLDRQIDERARREREVTNAAEDKTVGDSVLKQKELSEEERNKWLKEFGY